MNSPRQCVVVCHVTHTFLELAQPACLSQPHEEFAQHVRGIFGPRSRVGALIAHFSAMIAAYISAVTAFVVINAHGVPMQLRWLVPISIGTLVITAFALPYRLPKEFSLKFGALSARAKR